MPKNTPVPEQFQQHTIEEYPIENGPADYALYVAAATQRAEKLTQAILAKAFRGELVPTEADLARRENRSY